MSWYKRLFAEKSVVKPDLNRLSRDEYGCMMAYAASFRSEDPTTRVGCAITNTEGRILCTGYNGLPPGVPITAVDTSNKEEKNLYFIHAEANALALIRRGEGNTLYCTHSPCAQLCAQQIVAHDIKHVVYISQRPCKLFMKIFDKYSVAYRQVSDTELSRIGRLFDIHSKKILFAP